MACSHSSSMSIALPHSRRRLRPGRGWAGLLLSQLREMGGFAGGSCAVAWALGGRSGLCSEQLCAVRRLSFVVRRRLWVMNAGKSF